MGKFTISMVMFHSYVKLPEGINYYEPYCSLDDSRHHYSYENHFFSIMNHCEPLQTIIIHKLDYSPLFT